MNSEFETETSWTYEVGFLKDLWFDTKFRGSGYYIDITDYQHMNYMSSGLAPTADVYNVDARLYGIEMELTRSLVHDLSGHLYYTWQNWSKEDFPLAPEEEYDLMENLPRNKVTLGFNYKLWENGLVSLNSRYVGSRKAMNKEKIKDFITVDVGAEHVFKFSDESSFTLKAFVNNVTDEKYEQRYGYPMPGITTGISGTLSF